MQLFIITIWDRAKTLDTALHVEHADGTKFRIPCSISESDPKNKKKKKLTYLYSRTYTQLKKKSSIIKENTEK